MIVYLLKGMNLEYRIINLKQQKPHHVGNVVELQGGQVIAALLKASKMYKGGIKLNVHFHMNFHCQRLLEWQYIALDLGRIDLATSI